MTIPTFPTLPGEEWPGKRSPVWSNIRQKAVSGVETVVQLYTFPLWQWNKSYSYLGSGGGNTDWQTLVNFFNSLAGGALPFHYEDPDDNSVVAGTLGTGDGTTTKFNFVRSLTVGGFIEPIQDVTQAGVVIYDNGSPVSGSDYAFLTDPNWGFTYGIQFSVAPTSGHAITADFNYRWPCRFTQDTADFENFLTNFWSLKQLNFTSIKVI